MQQWQNGGGDQEEDDDDESDEDGDEEDEDQVIREMGGTPADVPPAFENINHALAVAVNAVDAAFRDPAFVNADGGICGQTPMPAAFEEAIEFLQAHSEVARAGIAAGEAAAAHDFENRERDQVMSDAPAPEAEEQQDQHEEQNAKDGEDQRTADAGGHGGW